MSHEVAICLDNIAMHKRASNHVPRCTLYTISPRLDYDTILGEKSCINQNQRVGTNHYGDFKLNIPATV